jgi:DNA-binding protein HU-beta
MAKATAAKKKSTKAKHLSKSEVVKTIAAALGEDLSVKHVKAVVEHLVELAHKELKKTGTFVIHGLAKFTVHKKPARPARKGINPFTKQEQTFAAKPASKAIRARAAKAAKDAIA